MRAKGSDYAFSDDVFPTRAMKISFVGMGKLGFPCALAAATRHDVIGFDISPHAARILKERRYPHREDGAQKFLEKTTLRVVKTVHEAVAHGDIIFIAVETPHRPEFEGITRMPEYRADFDYTALKSAVSMVAEVAEEMKKAVAVVVISTVLPGTSRREIYPLLNEYTKYVYNPFFIAMGTTIHDYLYPEMVLVGCDDKDRSALELVRQFYEVNTSSALEIMPVIDAEMTKVQYNVFLGMKIIAANTLMEACHKLGANCDNVSRALAKANDRVVSSKYMFGGMGDGGGCHPRDQIALSWLASDEQLNLSYNLYDAMVQAREKQTEWLADLCCDQMLDHTRPVIILGKAFKKGTNLTVGSPAVLLKNILDEFSNNEPPEILQWDPHIDPPRVFDKPAIFFIGTNHLEFFSMNFPEGSTIIDPWGIMEDRIGCKVIRIGRN